MDIISKDDQSPEYRDEDGQREEYLDDDYQGEDFESCEQVIAAKECTTGLTSFPSFPIFSSPRFTLQYPFKVWSASNGTDSFTGDDGLDIDWFFFLIKEWERFAF